MEARIYFKLSLPPYLTLCWWLLVAIFSFNLIWFAVLELANYTLVKISSEFAFWVRHLLMGESQGAVS